MADEAHGLGEAEPFDLRLQRLEFFAVAGKRQRHRLAVGAQPRHRVDQDIGALDVPELADIDDVGGVVRCWYGIEFIGGNAIEHAAHESGRLADGALIGVARERALEQEQVGAVHQRAFEPAVDRAFQRVQRVMQRTAMRRVDANGFAGAALEADERAGLGAVAMQHVRLQFSDQAHEMRPYHSVDRHRLAPDRKAVDAEFQARRDRRQRRFGAFAAGHAVGDDSDVVAAVGLAVGDVEDMAKDTADRRAYRVQDTKRLIWSAGHDQNQRSPTRTVSPGLIGVPSGTMVRIEPPPSVWVRVTRSRLARGENPPAMATALSTLMLGT